MPASTLSLTLFALTLAQVAPAEVSSTLSIDPPANMTPSLVDGRSKLAAQLDLMHYQQQQQLSQTIQQQASLALRGIALSLASSAQSVGVASANLAQSALQQTRGE